MKRALIMLPLLAGCQAIDPFTREGAWRPLHANEANLRAQVADPSTLQRGRDDPRADGQAMAAAVTRYRTDRVRPLAASGVSRLQATGSAGAPAAAAGGGDGGR